MPGTKVSPKSFATLGLVADPLNGAAAFQGHYESWPSLGPAQIQTLIPHFLSAICGSTEALPRNFVS